jgi:hypothetical protein
MNVNTILKGRFFPVHVTKEYKRRRVHLHTFLTSGVDGGKWLGLHLGRLFHGNDSGTFLIWGWWFTETFGMLQ